VRFSAERYDTFSDAPQASSAASFGTQGVNIWAVKPLSGLPARYPVVAEPVPAATPVVPLPEADEVFDAGSLGCGDGPLPAIAAQLRRMPAGAVLEIRSSDAGVAADLPAWCRMTGHQFLGGGSGPYLGRYRVRRRSD
jgi:TusA-related sulfurtransferase